MEPPSRRRLLQPRPLTSFLSFLFLSLSSARMGRRPARTTIKTFNFITHKD